MTDIKKPSARKTPFGYKSVIIFVDRDQTYQPLRHTFKTRDEAMAYSIKWIAANTPKNFKIRNRESD